MAELNTQELTYEGLLSLLTSFEPDVDFVNEEHLVEDGLLDSLDIAHIVFDIRRQFGIKIHAGLIRKENFESAKSIMALLVRIQDEI